ncbi:MAG TPA: LamG domain-containing protein [Verrucomicrobiota bacterium]|nr:LamG domain-containing protein [Verrucomicrobiota bacterium]
MISLHKLGVFAAVATVFWVNTQSQLAQEPSGAPEQRPVPLDSDPHLIGWWKFDEIDGNKALDSSGHGHDAFIEGGASLKTQSVPGRMGNSLMFVEQGPVVRVPGFKGVTGTAPRTVCAWVKTSADSGEIVSWGSNDFGKMWIFGHVRGRIGVTPKGGYLYINDSIADDNWHHVAVVVHEAEKPNLHDDVRLFKDGVPAVIHDIGLLDLWPIDTGSDIEVRIGRGFKGLIDDLRIYDRALSEEELTALFKLGSATKNDKTKGDHR